MLQGEPFWPQGATEWFALLRNAVITASMAGSGLYALLRWRILEWIKDEREARESAIAAEQQQREQADTSECKDRKTADKNIDERVMRIAQDVHNYMGKLELLQGSIHTAELKRAEEMGEMRSELRAGFAELKALVNKESRRN